MKKFFSIAMVAVMLVALCSTVFAADAVTLTVANVDAYKGEGDTVVVPVSVSDNAGFAAATFTVSYDNTKLAFEKVTAGDKFGGILTNNGDTIVWTDGSLSNNANNDVFVNLQFKVLDPTVDGKYEVTITDIDASNMDEQSVAFTVVAGSVNVTDKPVTTTEAPVPTTTAAPAPATTTAGTDGKKDSPKTADAGVAVAAVALAAAACFVATKKRK